MTDAILFDLDGTLWDATEAMTAMWNTPAQQELTGHRPVTHAQIMSYMGMPPVQRADRMIPDVPKAQRAAVFDRCMQQENDFILRHGARLYPGVEQTLETLSRSYRLMIASNCCSGYIEVFLAQAGAQDWICDFEHPGRTGLCKADNIRLLLQRNGIDRAILVGDAMVDYTAAQQAGIPFVWAAYGFGTVPEARWKLSALQELPALAPQVFQ